MYTLYMSASFVILGNISQNELQLLHSVAEQFSISLETVDRLEQIGKLSPASIRGVISYFPCTPQTLDRIFTALTTSTEKQFPFFQIVAPNEYPDFLRSYQITGIFHSPLTVHTVHNMITNLQFYEKVVFERSSIINEVIKYRKQRYQLLKIATALSSENNLDTLLDLILYESRDILQADAGSIYIRERIGPGKAFVNKIRFKIAQNDSVEITSKTREFLIPIDTNTIAGYVAHTAQSLNIGDVYTLDQSVPYKFGKDFDSTFGYRMKSMLTVPLKNIHGAVVGVIQLMNKKINRNRKLTSPEIVAEEVIPFSYTDEDFVQSIAALAAVSIERAQLHENIEQIFEGFLSSSIAAIDERDRVTSGHSRRVMGYAMAVVDAINKKDHGPFAVEHFSKARRRQLKFAALLHDIGKIGVPEALLTKECRLAAEHFAAIERKLDLIRFMLQTAESKKLEKWWCIEDVDRVRLFLEQINSAGYITDQDYASLLLIKEKKFIDSYGKKRNLLTDQEFECLSIRRGNLTKHERTIINSHTIASNRILSKIPWSEELERIPDIATHHHERLDGSGYPEGLRDSQINLELRILAVVDIYDALVAQDRPYKPATPPKKAITILREEAQRGRVDNDIVELFVDDDVYKIFSRKKHSKVSTVQKSSKKKGHVRRNRQKRKADCVY